MGIGLPSYITVHNTTVVVCIELKHLRDKVHGWIQNCIACIGVSGADPGRATAWYPAPHRTPCCHKLTAMLIVRAVRARNMCRPCEKYVPFGYKNAVKQQDGRRDGRRLPPPYGIAESQPTSCGAGVIWASQTRTADPTNMNYARLNPDFHRISEEVTHSTLNARQQIPDPPIEPRLSSNFGGSDP